MSSIKEVIDILDRYPVEDGFNHACEIEILRIIATGLSYSIYDAYREYSNKKISIAVSLIKLLGRQSSGVFPEFINLFKEALQHEDIEIRDAAVCALEHLCDERALPLLEDYIPTEQVDWLREYAQQVVGEYPEL